MKNLILLIACLSLAGVSYAQGSVDENSKATSDQRYVNEANKKSKQGKKKISTKEKVKIQKKQARAAEHMNTQKASRRKPKKK